VTAAIDDARHILKQGVAVRSVRVHVLFGASVGYKLLDSINVVEAISIVSLNLDDEKEHSCHPLYIGRSRTNGLGIGAKVNGGVKSVAAGTRTNLLVQFSIIAAASGLDHAPPPPAAPLHIGAWGFSDCLPGKWIRIIELRVATVFAHGNVNARFLPVVREGFTSARPSSILAWQLWVPVSKPIVLGFRSAN
jgi:hypothetical protein